MKRQINIGETSIIWIVLIISIPALCVNLGLLPLISDEPTRGIVTLEMIFSGNYIQPTIGGELYFNKPPLFNWLQVLLVKLTGSMDEWVFRLPSVLSAYFLALLIYLFTRKHLKEYAIIAALGFLTAGRVLFWDSFMGLIDLTYSLVIFGSFAWMIHFNSKSRYLLFFLGSYFLAGIGFLMKGFPSLAFQALSIAGLLIYDKKFKQLFTWKHLLGIILFIALVGSYYFTYSRKYPFDHAIETLLRESNRIQSSNGGLSRWFLHLLYFPVNFIFEFAPLTLLGFLLFIKQVRVKTFEQPFYRHILLLFLVNIVIYWLSADMRSRYLFMLIPLAYIILVKAYSVAAQVNTRFFSAFQTFLIVSSLLVSLSTLVYPLWSETSGFKGVVSVSILLTLTGIGFTYLAFRNRKLVLFSLFGVLLLARVGFNLFNLPARLNSYPDLDYKEGEIAAAGKTTGHPLYIYKSTSINHDAIFYITRERQSKLERTYELESPDAFYLVDRENLHTFARDNNEHAVVDSFNIKLNESTIFLVKSLK